MDAVNYHTANQLERYSALITDCRKQCTVKTVWTELQ